MGSIYIENSSEFDNVKTNLSGGSIDFTFTTGIKTVPEELTFSNYSELFIQEGIINGGYEFEDQLNKINIIDGSTLTVSDYAEFNRIDLNVEDFGVVNYTNTYHFTESEINISNSGILNFVSGGVYSPIEKITAGNGGRVVVDENSKLVITPSTNITMESGSYLILKNGSELVIEDGVNLLQTEGINIIINGNAKITGNIGQSYASIVVTDDSQLTLGAGSNIDLRYIPTPSLTLGVNSELLIESNSEFRFGPSTQAECNAGSKITVQDGGTLYAYEASLTGNDEESWEGIIAEVGSNVTLITTSISKAIWGINAFAANLNIFHTSFMDCENGVSLVNCAFTVDEFGVETCSDFILKDNYFSGKNIGSGIALVHSNGIFENNTVKNFEHGVDLTLCSPTLTKNTITENINYGLYITGYNSDPTLVDASGTANELNNEIYNNAMDKLYYQGGQIYMKYSAGLYMHEGYNNIYSDAIGANPDIPCIRGVSHYSPSKVALPDHVSISGRYNYWGAAEITEDDFVFYFDLYDRYSVGYTPYALTPYESGVPTPPVYSNHEPVTPESKLLSLAMKLEYNGNYKPAIKLYDKVINKYKESSEYYVAMSRLPSVYAKAELDTDPLIRVYDDALASDSTSNKKFFKEMKISTKIKGKKYDEAIILAEEMRDEASSEGEVILAEIDITICNMMINAQNNGKSRSTEDHSKTLKDLLAKLNGTESKSETTDIAGVKLPTEFALYQNYPNPFNPTTEIKYALSQDANINIRIYSSNGSLVADLVNASQSIGYHSVTFDGAKLSNGIYYYALEVNGNVINTKRMLLIK
ncbi:MAG: T9SS type A sorting domain-containing protein [Candidatus Delongbacteria bacterium]|nr:T9SS type A sorting domain-containing protein [Candidatus Delongbacteria bacterium]